MTTIAISEAEEDITGLLVDVARMTSVEDCDGITARVGAGDLGVTGVHCKIKYNSTIDDLEFVAEGEGANGIAVKWKAAFASIKSVLWFGDDILIRAESQPIMMLCI